MFITPEIVEQVPASGRTSHGHSVTSAEADNFFRVLLLANHDWVKFWEGDVSHLPNKKQDQQRAHSRNFITSSSMKRYSDKIEYTTRKLNGVLTAYARIKH